MFRIITNLFFGEQEKSTEDTGHVGAEDEEWHVVDHQDAVADDQQEEALLDNHSTSAVRDDSTISQQDADINVNPPETQDHNKNSAFEAVDSILFQTKGVAHAPLCACVQKAKAWAQRHSSSRNTIQRKNRIRQGIHKQAFHLHQPNHRNLCH